MTTNNQIITRFAPSPTGFLHIGGARTALFNYLFAKHHGGKFLLRIEDTDRARSTDEATNAIFDGLKWLGLQWDDEPVFQFARTRRHAEVARQMVDSGNAYYCYTTQEELQEFRKNNPNQKFRSPWRDNKQNNANIPPGNANIPPGGIQPVIRLKAPQSGNITLYDHVRKEVSVDAAELDDMILLRADGTPTYMLAVVVDDHDMQISHVIRGEDHFTNSFRQLLVYQAMSWQVPQFAHIPLIHGADGTKLSKRHGALGVDAYREMGFLPEALRNYLLRLGWSHGDSGIISDAQAIEWFSLEAIGSSPSRLDLDKLKSLNAHYMKNSSVKRLCDLLPKNFASYKERIELAMPWLVERAQTIPELAKQAEFLIAVRPLIKSEKAAAILSEAKSWRGEGKELFAAQKDWNEASLKEAAEQFMSNKSLKTKQFMPAIRAAISGQESSAGSIYQIMNALKREETLGRISDCC